MIVPTYWAEYRAHRPRTRTQKQKTVCRFGWSERSQAEAEAMAKARADEALQDFVSGKTSTKWRERKVAYNGAEGVPIREEILVRHGDAVITRNAYGAHCLNTPNVAFADIDFQTKPSGWFLFGHVIPLMTLAAGAMITLHWFALFVPALIVGLLAGIALGPLTHRALQTLRGGALAIARRRLHQFLRKHPDWHVRAYRTSAGLRLLVLHQTFSPSDPVVREFFNDLGVDPLYRKMCLNQQCFRARLTAKPWRIGIGSHMKPSPGVWPIKPEQQGKRAQWTTAYEAAARGYAACAFSESLGSGVTNPIAAKVQALHDERSQSLSDKPLA